MDESWHLNIDLLATTPFSQGICYILVEKELPSNFPICDRLILILSDKVNVTVEAASEIDKAPSSIQRLCIDLFRSACEAK